MRLALKFNLATPRRVFVFFWNWVQVEVALAVEHDLRDAPVELILGLAQAFGELVSHELRVAGPPFQRLGNKVVGKALELLVAVLHLVVLGIEDHRLLNVFDVALRELVLAD